MEPPEDGGNQSECSLVVHPSTDLKEYETQYLGFTPKSFIDAVYNSMVEYLGDMVEVLQQFILQDERFKDLISPELLGEASERTFIKGRANLDKAVDRLEHYLMKSIFHIPSGLVLPEDMVHATNPVTKSADKKLDDELEVLREKIRNAQYTNLILQKWLRDVDKTQHILDTYLAQLQKLEVICREENVSDLAETVSFVAERSRRLLYQCKRLKATHHTERNNNEEPSIPGRMGDNGS